MFFPTFLKPIVSTDKLHHSAWSLGDLEFGCLKFGMVRFWDGWSFGMFWCFGMDLDCLEFGVLGVIAIRLWVDVLELTEQLVDCKLSPAFLQPLILLPSCNSSFYWQAAVDMGIMTACVGGFTGISNTTTDDAISTASELFDIINHFPRFPFYCKTRSHFYCTGRQTVGWDVGADGGCMWIQFLRIQSPSLTFS